LSVGSLEYILRHDLILYFFSEKNTSNTYQWKEVSIFCIRMPMYHAHLLEKNHRTTLLGKSWLRCYARVKDAVHDPRRPPPCHGLTTRQWLLEVEFSRKSRTKL